MIGVIKVGGSLLDFEAMPARLRGLIASLPCTKIYVLFGGGLFADGVRRYDQVHQLGQKTSHWLAIKAMGISAAVGQTLFPDWPRVDEIEGAENPDRRVCIFECEKWIRRFSSSLPDSIDFQSWEFTSDSIAALLAMNLKAQYLCLLKSHAFAGNQQEYNWTAGLDDGRWVDPCFGPVLKHWETTIPQEYRQLQTKIINLRGTNPMDSRSPLEIE